MLTYHVKKKKRTRYTYRFVALGILLVCGSQIVMFFMGYGRAHMFGNIIAFLFAAYAVYLFMSSFRNNAYDTDYEFQPDHFVVHAKHGDLKYRYSDITDLSQIIPENDVIYSIIHITVERKSFILPFSYKKELADKIYAFLNERMTSQKLMIETKSNSQGN